MKEFWIKNKLAIVIIAYIALIVPGSYFSAKLLLGKIADTADSIQEGILDDQLRKSKIGDIPRMEEISKNIAQNSDATASIIDESMEIDFIKSLETLADDTGNEITLSVDDPEKDKATQKATTNSKDKQTEKGIKDSLSHSKFISLNIMLSGSYESMVDFVHKLENDRYYVNVISIDSRKDQRQAGSSNQGNGSIFISSGRNDELGDSPSEKDDSEKLTTTLKAVVYLQ
ncbi:MAG: hypothetical protein HGB08_03265 [Candidatus Moranbacteria bacterium]|nr:hypothetical protein [Candidatus Moranbacteria bacterium]